MARFVLVGPLVSVGSKHLPLYETNFLLSFGLFAIFAEAQNVAV